MASEKVWVIGHQGLLGQAVTRNLRASPHAQVIGTGSEVSVLDRKALWRFANAHQPSRIVNCSGYTLVDQAERELEAAHALNVTGPQNLLTVATALGVGLQHFSTDYVFGGRGLTPLKEQDRPAPLGAYGRTKRLGECYLLEDGRAQVIRSAWLFGHGRKNFVTTMLELFSWERDAISVVNDQVGSPTFTKDLAEGARQLAILAGGGMFHLTNYGEASWYELASETQAMARDLNLPIQRAELKPCASSEYPRAAERPAYSALNGDKAALIIGKYQRSWHSALREYMQEMKDRSPAEAA